MTSAMSPRKRSPLNRQLASRPGTICLTKTPVPLSPRIRVSDVSFITGQNPYENRVLRSIAFIDLSGFTAYNDELGDMAASQVLVKFRALVREVCAQHGVRIAKWLGDGAMLVAVEAEELAETLTDLEGYTRGDEWVLKLRCGVATGQVILFEGDDYIGGSVNLASRLCDLAPPGKAFAPAHFPSSLMVNTRVRAVGEFDIKGFDEAVQVVELSAR